MPPVFALLFAGVFHAVLLMAHGTHIAFAHGVAWGTGRRDSPVSSSDLARRFERSVTNNVESLIAFVPIAGLAVLYDVRSAGVEQAALVYLLARLAFVGMYLLNIPYLRTAAWLTGQGAIFSLAATVFLAIR